MVRLLVVLTVTALLCACEEDKGQDGWLLVQNQTGEPIVVMDRGVTDPNLLVLGLEPGEAGRAPREPRDTDVLEAHTGSATGPVVATRDVDAGRECTETWVVEAVPATTG